MFYFINIEEPSVDIIMFYFTNIVEAGVDRVAPGDEGSTRGWALG